MAPDNRDSVRPEDLAALRATARSLEEELTVLRRRLQEAPARLRAMEERLVETKGRLSQAVAQNEKLSAVLEEARQQLTVLREEVEKLSAPPNAFGAVLGVNEDGTVDVMVSGRKLRVNAQPSIEVKQLQIGQEVLLNESMNLVDVRNFETTGEIAAVKENLGDGRLLVLAHADEERVVELSDPMAGEPVRAGDHVRIDNRTGLVLERIVRPEVEELVLEEVPDVTYEHVGGLHGQIETIRDAVELPYIHKDKFDRYRLEAPKGVLLYGPPGNGKSSLAKRIGRVFKNTIYVPYCVDIDGQIMKVYDPSIHEEADKDHTDAEQGSIVQDKVDRRWVACRRPVVVVGVGIDKGVSTNFRVPVLMQKNATVHGIVFAHLYPRVPELIRRFLPLLREGIFKMNIHRMFPMEAANEAHTLVHSGNVLGKVELKL